LPAVVCLVPDVRRRLDACVSIWLGQRLRVHWRTTVSWMLCGGLLRGG
jgi:hypothetical protein